jgi:D-serine deaminase-like pyridoxal phosphate-dependent protein
MTNSLQNVETPALMVDLDLLEYNIESASTLVASTGKMIRPHIKTHRTSGLALKQLGSNNVSGVTCATVGEAEIMVDAGITDILLANEVISNNKIRRLLALSSRAKISVAVDSLEQVKKLSIEAVRQEVTIDVLVDIDVGLGRCGVRDISSAVNLSRNIMNLNGLRFTGIMGYEGRLRVSTDKRTDKLMNAINMLEDVKSAIESTGIEVSVVSGGGTSTLLDLLHNPIITEIQAGTYVLMEHDLYGLGLPFKCAAYVLGLVISRSLGRIVVDVGRKTVGCDYGPPITDIGRIISVSEEHIVIECNEYCPPLGTQIKLTPSHVRTTFNLHDKVWLTRGNKTIEQLSIDARGRSQ